MIDEKVRALVEQGHIAEAATLTLETFGPELRGYLRGTLGHAEEADDVFQELSEAIWFGLPAFRFQCALRTWCYAIAHNRVVKRFSRYSRKNRVRLNTQDEGRLPARSLSSTLEAQHRASLAQTAAEALTPDQREILILRVERRLSFREIAGVLGLPDEAAARKRFQRAKDRLKQLVSAAQEEEVEARL